MNTPDQINLNGNWRFQFDRFGHGEQLGYAQADFDDQAWLPAPVPGTFAHALPSLEMTRAHGWYRHKFHIPQSWGDRRIGLRFGAVNDHCRVFLNGQLAGRHDLGYVPFEIDITKLARVGADNILAVWVDNDVSYPGDLPGIEVGWRPYAGILRDVTLFTTGSVWLDKIRLCATWADDAGLLVIQGEIHNSGIQTWSGQVVADCVVQTPGSPAPAPVMMAITVPAGSSQEFKLEGRPKNVAPWHPDAPTIYPVRVWLEQAGRIADAWERRTGFRTLTVEQARICLNGKPIFLKGFNLHEDSPTAQIAQDPANARRSLTDIKAMGANFVRLAHYPHDPSTLDICDEIGLIVLAEVPLYSLWSEPSRSPEVLPKKLASAKYMLEKMICRDSHHPSIAFWSVSNETWDDNPAMAAGNAALIRDVRQLDPSRFAVHVSHYWPTAPSFDEDDVICINAYPSVVEYEKNPHYDLKQAGIYCTEGINKLHTLYPHKPIIVTEFGFIVYDGMRGAIGGEDMQARVIETEARGMLASPHCGGFALWIYADHPWPGGQIAPYGVVSRDRLQRRISYSTMLELLAAK